MEQATGKAGEEKPSSGRVPRKAEWQDAKFQGVPDKFFDPETGDLDLRRVTGEEARRFLMRQGLKLPIMRSSKRREKKKE